MGIWNWLKSFLVLLARGRGFGVEELACRIGIPLELLRHVQPEYREFLIPKRSGGTRRILAPVESLKKLQRRILARLLSRLRAHPAAMAYERGRSISHNARIHVGKPVVLRMDLKDFFPSTSARRVKRYFRRIGWNRPAAKLLTRICTFEGGLPQGAPTSPRLSNLVNFQLDARLTALAASRRFRNPRTGKQLHEIEIGATYSRYADDLTFSFPSDDRKVIRYVVYVTRVIAKDLGYIVHRGRKLRAIRQHQRQTVTGLVVNEKVNLPRSTRRWLRAVEHRVACGRSATLTPAQLDGWRALKAMIDKPSTTEGESSQGAISEWT